MLSLVVENADNNTYKHVSFCPIVMCMFMQDANLTIYWRCDIFLSISVDFLREKQLIAQHIT